MYYTRKIFTKKDLREGQLLEYMEMNTKNKYYYLVTGCSVCKNGRLLVKKMILIDNKGYTIKVKSLNDNLSYKNLILSKVYSNMMYTKVNNDISTSLMDVSLRKVLFDNNVVYMSQKEVIQMLAKQINKNIIII